MPPSLIQRCAVDWQVVEREWYLKTIKTQNDEGGGNDCNCDDDDYECKEKAKQFGVETPPTLILIVI